MSYFDFFGYRAHATAVRSVCRCHPYHARASRAGPPTVSTAWSVTVRWYGRPCGLISRLPNGRVKSRVCDRPSSHLFICRC